MRQNLWWQIGSGWTRLVPLTQLVIVIESLNIERMCIFYAWSSYVKSELTWSIDAPLQGVITSLALYMGTLPCMTYVYGEPVCAIFSVCKVYEKQSVYISTDVCECFLLSLAVMFKVPLSMYDHCCYNICMYVFVELLLSVLLGCWWNDTCSCYPTRVQRPKRSMA